jgi:UDP-N-acetylglucosamine 4,6-dehydratase
MLTDHCAAFDGATLLVTGGTGTFGTAVLRRFMDVPLREIRVFSRDEKKQDDMRRLWRDPRLRFYIGDVREPRSVADAMQGVDYVFHAAALKQVPSCEFYPMEAIRTNAIGAENVLRAATEARVRRAIVLSTDKAAYPINAMGLSKALMEKIMSARARLAESAGTIMCATRYGNVMASRGSVIPLFIEQILSGGPVTVTDPEMTRFMMSIEEAVELVLYAFQHSEPGDLFVRKAPACTIGTLVEALTTILARQVPLRVIGTRHGEKLYETLLTREEMARAKDLGDYYRVPADTRDLNYALYFTEGAQEVSRAEDFHSHNAPRLDVKGTTDLLMGLEVVRQAMRAEPTIGASIT